MIELKLPRLSASPFGLARSGLRWLAPSGEEVAARTAIAVCGVRVVGARGAERPLPLAEERNDLQVVLAPSAAGRIQYRTELSKGGYQDLTEIGDWNPHEVIGSLSTAAEGAELLPVVLAGRRGFENGEGRGALLAGWHERARASWEGQGTGRFGTVLAYGTCEQTAVFRGEDMAVLSWFARAPGPAQVMWIGDDRSVHSSAVILQHLRRTPAEARAITEAVQAWIGERLAGGGDGAFPGFLPEAARGTLQGRWPEAQNVLYALHLLTESMATSPLLERSEVITRAGVAEQGPPDAVAISLGSEFAPHFRHRRTGWIVAIHGFRFGGFIGPVVADWLRRDFEPLSRTVADVERDLAALADELTARTGASLIVQNLISSTATDRVANYAWIGDAFASSTAVISNESNLMLAGLTRHPAISVLDSDAIAAELGVRHCPDRFHAARPLLEAQRDELHRVLRDRKVPGF
jgi:hypothetical protein